MTPARRPGPRLVETPPRDEPRQPEPPSAPPRPAPAASAAAKPKPRPPEPVETGPAPAKPSAYEQAVRIETRAAAPAQESAPRSAPGPAPQPRVGVIVMGGAPADAALAGAQGADAVVYVAPTVESAEAARRAGAQAIDVPAGAQNPGRARNAGYRHLMKPKPEAAPGLTYVQFVEAGAALAPGWLDAAVKFMERRPEVAVVEGATLEARAPRGRNAGETGEIQTSGPTLLVRAEAFEAAGGYRGDLPVNETEDLCIRLRRRGAHIWRLDAPMATLRRGSVSGSWWARAVRDGYRYAHGVRLHGAPPERLYVGEHARSLIWGAAIPFLILCFAAIGAAAAQIFGRGLNPFGVAGAILGFGAALYLARIVLVALFASRGRRNPLVYATSATFGHVPEFIGAWRFYASRDARRAEP